MPLWSIHPKLGCIICSRCAKTRGFSPCTQVQSLGFQQNLLAEWPKAVFLHLRGIADAHRAQDRSKSLGCVSLQVAHLIPTFSRSVQTLALLSCSSPCLGKRIFLYISGYICIDSWSMSSKETSLCTAKHTGEKPRLPTPCAHPAVAPGRDRDLTKTDGKCRAQGPQAHQLPHSSWLL